MKKLFLCLLPIQAICCEFCIKEFKEHKDFVMSKIDDLDYEHEYSDKKSYQVGQISGYYLGRQTATEDMIRIMKKNHDHEHVIKLKRKK